MYASQRCNDISQEATGTGIDIACLRIRGSFTEPRVQTNKMTVVKAHTKTGTYFDDHSSSAISLLYVWESLMKLRHKLANTACLSASVVFSPRTHT